MNIGETVFAKASEKHFEGQEEKISQDIKAEIEALNSGLRAAGSDTHFFVAHEPQNHFLKIQKTKLKGPVMWTGEISDHMPTMRVTFSPDKDLMTLSTDIAFFNHKMVNDYTRHSNFKYEDADNLKSSIADAVLNKLSSEDLSILHEHQQSLKNHSLEVT